jgi:hypothetical protein
MKFNINDTIRVRLHPAAIDVLRKEHNDIFSDAKRYVFKPPEVDSEGYSKFQVWDFMASFGGSMQLGSRPPFDTTIDIPALDPPKQFLNDKSRVFVMTTIGWIIGTFLYEFFARHH